MQLTRANNNYKNMLPIHSTQSGTTKMLPRPPVILLQGQGCTTAPVVGVWEPVCKFLVFGKDFSPVRCKPVTLVLRFHWSHRGIAVLGAEVPPWCSRTWVTAGQVGQHSRSARCVRIGHEEVLTHTGETSRVSSLVVTHAWVNTEAYGGINHACSFKTLLNTPPSTVKHFLLSLKNF